MAERTAKTALFDAFAQVGKALGSGRRIELLDVLANGERTVEELARQTDLSLANASRHLQVLRQAGLVTTHRQGTFVAYRLATPYLGGSDELEPVTRQELARRLQAGEPLVVVDVRPAAEHAAGHVPGAVSIPLADLRRRLAELPADREIVAYCRGPYCAFAPEAVRLLRSEGFAARRLEDGLPEWVAAELPVSSA